MSIKPNGNEESSSNSWMGPKGFDEAKYYKDEKYEIGIQHSDERIYLVPNKVSESDF